MSSSIPRFYFDSEDYRLLRVVGEVLGQERGTLKEARTLLRPSLHPHGIQTLASSSNLRIAFAVINLLNLLETGQAQERLQVLRSLHDEVLSSSGSMRRNTARVLIQIMKTLVRSQGSELEQLKLAHDFRVAASGKPRNILKQLRKYHLVEMPETWNQLSFDDRVHDANTKGRKSPTHLIMDAWIKGIRRLTVVYYNYVDAGVVEELLTAAEIMDIEVHIGVEVTALHRGRFVQLIWEPKGFDECATYLKFLSQPQVQDFMQEGREVAQRHNKYVYGLLDLFNKKHRITLQDEFGIDFPCLDQVKFIDFIGVGQPSTDHLGGYIAKVVRPVIKERVKLLNDQYAATGDREERAEILDKLKALNQLGADYFVDAYLLPGENPTLTYLLQPAKDDPPLLRRSPNEMIVALEKIHSVNSFTLNTVNLAQADVIEILYECRGGIRCIEFFSLRDLTQKRFRDGEALAELKTALNKADVVALKRIVRNNIGQVCFGDTVCEQSSDEVVSLRNILNDINTLAEMYVRQPLQTYIGSGSTGNFASTFGMGFVVLDTLPVRAQREYARSVQNHGVFCIPISTEVWEKFTYKPRKGITDLGKRFLAFAKSFPFFKRLGQTCTKSYLATEIKVAKGRCGNIGLLGGRSLAGNGFAIKAAELVNHKGAQRIPLRYLNSNVLNWLKVIVGFVPAFLTFSLTKDWWLLAYMGAFIWFAITGGRNIIQAVVGGGGARNISLLHWHEYVDWNRVSDSLLYTGFSVPLLDWLCKTVVLDHGFGVNIGNNALLLYTVMSITNGFYICSHNLFRGLPPKAIFGNFFRSLLSIPVAVLFSWVIGGILGACGVVAGGLILQKWAAVISKFASDCVGGIIEGGADRGDNVRMRVWDYQTKFQRVLQLYTKIEILFPERNVLQVMAKPDNFLLELRERRSGIEEALIFDSLDFLTLWLYQPRAATALEHILRQMSTDERCVFFMSQLILTQEREVSQLLLAGSLGERFARALSFYLDSYRQYLRGLDALLEKIGTTEHRQLCGEKPWEIGDLRLGF